MVGQLDSPWGNTVRRIEFVVDFSIFSDLYRTPTGVVDTVVSRYMVTNR